KRLSEQRGHKNTRDEFITSHNLHAVCTPSADGLYAVCRRERERGRGREGERDRERERERVRETERERERERVGGFGRYQWLHVTLISLPGLLMASQNLLNNFVSGIPAHHCRLPANHSLYSLPANHSLYNLSLHQVDEKQLLKAFIPLDSSGTRLDRCRRFVEPQWRLLDANSSANVSALQTEGCLDGWTFDTSEFLATTVSEHLKALLPRKHRRRGLSSGRLGRLKSWLALSPDLAWSNAGIPQEYEAFYRLISRRISAPAGSFLVPVVGQLDECLAVRHYRPRLRGVNPAISSR
ncbi:hypothetical protein FQN60_005407, partial [Etheostoma spectabile]